MPANKISKKGKKTGRYYYSVTIDGKRKKIASRTGETQGEFKKRCDALDKAASVVGFDREPTLDELFNEWREKYLNVKCGAAERRTTPYTYKKYVQEHFGHRKISQIKRADVYSLIIDLADKGLGKSTQDKARLCISRPWNWAINVLHLEIPNPCHGLRITSKSQKQKDARTKNTVRFLSQEEIDHFFEVAKASKYYVYFRLLLLTGLRPSEGLGLQWADVSETGIKVQRSITDDGLGDLKTAWAYRTVPVAPELSALLVEHRTQSKSIWLFPSANGIPSLNAARCALHNSLKQTAIWRAAGKRRKAFLIEPPMKFTLYNFRHTFATRLARIMPIKALQTIMGHSDSTVTLKYYVGIDEAAMQSAANQIASAFATKLTTNNESEQSFEIAKAP